MNIGVSSIVTYDPNNHKSEEKKVMIEGYEYSEDIFDPIV